MHSAVLCFLALAALFLAASLVGFLFVFKEPPLDCTSAPVVIARSSLLAAGRLSLAAATVITAALRYFVASVTDGLADTGEFIPQFCAELSGLSSGDHVLLAFLALLVIAPVAFFCSKV